MATKIVYHIPLDDDGNRRKHERGPLKGKEVAVERHELPVIDAHDAVRQFPSQYSFARPEGVDDADVLDKRVAPLSVTEEPLAPNGDPGNPAVMTAPRIDPVDRPPLGGGPSESEVPDRRPRSSRTAATDRNDLG